MEPQEGPWELVGTTSDELIEFGEKLQRSKRDQDRTLAVKVCPIRCAQDMDSWRWHISSLISSPLGT